MERRSFLERLEIVAPALSNHRLIPVMTHVWFRGERLQAFNDAISISIPMQTDFRGAVPGTILIALIASSQAKQVEFKPSKKELHIKASSSDLHLALMGEDQFCFDIPDPEDSLEHRLRIDMRELVKAIELCMTSVGNDATVPDQLGITLQPRNGVLHLYATNNSTITTAELKVEDVPFTERVILSTQFCEQMIRLCRGGKEPVLEVHDDHVLLSVEREVGKTPLNILLFGRLIESERPIGFQSMIDHHFPAKVHNQLVAIPKKWPGILDRAIIITDQAVEKNYSTISVSEGELKFISVSERGEISDTAPVDGHPSVKVNIEAKLLKAVEGKFEHMLMTPDCAVMSRKGALHIVAARPMEPAE